MRKALVVAGGAWLVFMSLLGFVLVPQGSNTAGTVLAAAAALSGGQEGRGPACGPTGAGGQVAVAAARWAGFPAGALPTAVAIAKAESGWVPTATHVNSNGSTDYGMWQINSVHGALLAQGSWSDPYDNAAMAYQVWTDAGGSWTPWSTFNSGSYVQYLGEAEAAIAGSTPCTDTPPSGTGAHTQADLVALGRWLVSKGYSPGEGPPPFGPIHQVHATNSYHYRMGPSGVEGLALDVNWRGPGSEMAAMDAIADLLVSHGWRVIWRTAHHFDHLHVDCGPAGRVWL